MPWAVAFHPRFVPEFETLAEAVQDELLAHARLLAEFGPLLGRPTVDTLKGSRIPNLKELRFSAGGGVWRAAFAFDRHRIALLLVAGTSAARTKRAFTGTLSPRPKRAGPRWEIEGMATSLKDMLDRLPPERRRPVDARAEELIAQEMTLRELRQALHQTQLELARKTGKSQVALSRLERQSDMLVSTLSDVVRGLGGRLRIVAELPGRPPVYLTGLGDLGQGLGRRASLRLGGFGGIPSRSRRGARVGRCTRGQA